MQPAVKLNFTSFSVGFCYDWVQVENWKMWIAYAAATETRRRKARKKIHQTCFLFMSNTRARKPNAVEKSLKSEVCRLRICLWNGLKRQLIWHERISNYHLFINPFFFVNIRYDVILSRLDRANSMKVLKHLANVDFRCEAASWLTSVLQNESSAEFALQLHRYKRI